MRTRTQTFSIAIFVACLALTMGAECTPHARTPPFLCVCVCFITGSLVRIRCCLLTRATRVAQASGAHGARQNACEVCQHTPSHQFSPEHRLSLFVCLATSHSSTVRIRRSAGRAIFIAHSCPPPSTSDQEQARIRSYDGKTAIIRSFPSKVGVSLCYYSNPRACTYTHNRPERGEEQATRSPS